MTGSSKIEVKRLNHRVKLPRKQRQLRRIQNGDLLSVVLLIGDPQFQPQAGQAIDPAFWGLTSRAPTNQRSIGELLQVVGVLRKPPLEVELRTRCCGEFRGSSWPFWQKEKEQENQRRTEGTTPHDNLTELRFPRCRHLSFCVLFLLFFNSFPPLTFFVPLPSFRVPF